MLALAFALDRLYPQLMAPPERHCEEGSLHIKLAAVDDGPIFADRALLAAFSSCVRGLPAESEEWDISGLVVEGQAVERHTVVAWLNAVYTQTLDEPFEQPEVNIAGSMRGLARLLAFADAVGSSKFLMRSLLADLDEIVVEVDLDKLLPEEGEDQQQHNQTQHYTQRILKLKAIEHHNWQGQTGSGYLTLEKWLTGCQTLRPVIELGTAAHRAALVHQVAQQTEVLLYYAHSLKLPALQHMLHRFLQNNTNLVLSLLYGSMGLVMSDRVVDAAVDKHFCRQALLNSIVTQQGGLQPHPHAEVLLRPVGATIPDLSFDAVLARDAFGCKKGDIVPVALVLHADGREPCIKVNGQNHVVQLLIGTSVWDAASMHALMGQTDNITETPGSAE